MGVYQCRRKTISGSAWTDVQSRVSREFKSAVGNPRRRPYIRSAYFGGRKIFIDTYWQSLMRKSHRDRFRRAILLSVTIELIKHSKLPPGISSKGQTTLYRFMGLSGDGCAFAVHIKQDARDQKFLMSSYPL